MTVIEYKSGDVIDGKFAVEEELGRGGMGVVVKVADSDDDKQYALKYCPSSEEEGRKRFAREVRIMAGIEHAHVMPIIAYNSDHDPPYFIMPLASRSLSDEIDAGISEIEALAAFKEICLGVQAIHNSQATHRDIKPDNAMRLDDNRVVVTDLGLARLEERDTTVLTQTSTFLGTRMYCAPEQLQPGGSREADVRTDIYQLGKALYHLITGDPPALIDTNRLPGGLGYIVEKATRQHPDHRYQTVGELMDAIASYTRTKAPDASADQEFEAVYDEAVSILQENKYSTKNLQRLLELLRHLDEDDEYYIKQFERIPGQLLKVIASNLPDELEGPLRTYSEAIEEVVGGYAFEHAETVANRMKWVCAGSKNAKNTVVAIRTIMIAAVKLNRFKAMEVFDQMLLEVEDPDTAVAIAEMLKEEAAYYDHLADRIPKPKLHPAIRAVAENLSRKN